MKPDEMGTALALVVAGEPEAGPIDLVAEEFDDLAGDDSPMEADLGELDSYLVELLRPGEPLDDHDDADEGDDVAEMALLQELGIELDDDEPPLSARAVRPPLAGLDMLDSDPDLDPDPGADDDLVA
jgi:hypothetical protein